jgi:hypothetical protein
VSSGAVTVEAADHVFDNVMLVKIFRVRGPLQHSLLIVAVKTQVLKHLRLFARDVSMAPFTLAFTNGRVLMS